MKSGKNEIAKYGMTCVQNPDGTQCDTRPESQCKKFNEKRNPNEAGFYYNWIVKDISKDVAILIERSMTATYILNPRHLGGLPSHHFLPCFKQGDDFEDIRERLKRALKHIEEQVNKYGK